MELVLECWVNRHMCACAVCDLVAVEIDFLRQCSLVTVSVSRELCCDATL